MTWRLDVSTFDSARIAADLEDLREEFRLLVAELAECRDVHTGDVDAYERRLAGTYQPRDETAL